MTGTEGASAALHAELARLRAVTRLAGVPVAQFDRERRYVWVNDEYGSLVGRRSDDIVGRRIDEVIGERAHATVAPFVERVLRGERVEYEAEVELATGRHFVQSILAPTHDERGGVDGWIGIVRDVTERRRYEETQARFAAIVACSDDAIVGKTLDGIVTSWNDGAVRLFGYTAEEMIGQPIQRLMPSDRIDDMMHILGQIRAGRRVDHYETERIRKDGTRIHVSLTVSPIKDAAGTVIGASKIARDVTERHRAEMQLRETLALLAILNRTSALLSAELDLSKLVQAVTDAATEVTGARYGAFVFDVPGSGEALAPYALAGVPRDARASFPLPRAGALIDVTLREERVVRLDDVRLDPRYGGAASDDGTAPGELPVASYLAAPLVSRGGVLGGLFFGHPEPGAFTERDERFVVAFAAQAAAAIDNARLYEAERRSRARAEAASRAKDDFLSMVSHELRTPLQSMLGWVAVLRQGRLPPERAARALDAIERSGRLQAKLIEDLLDVSRIVQGRLDMERRPVALHTVADAALEAIRPEAAVKDVAIEASLDGDVTVIGDPVRLEQVVGNLLRNAVKFTPAGRSVHVSVQRSGDAARIVVRDEGEGIDADFLPHVFEPFRQAEDVRKRTTSGLGLGLAIVKSLVEHHGGQVAAASPGLGRGATFTITLPLAGPSATSELGEVRPGSGSVESGT
ncbi:MAG: PAS domain S-box protein [Thermodesulfobacteriota bacterium]